MAAAEGSEADAGVFDTGDDAVGADADEGDAPNSSRQLPILQHQAGNTAEFRRVMRDQRHLDGQ